jgi:hypothetical protein
MPRFFFHMRDGDWLVEDPEGSELPDLEAARAKAADLARDYLAGRLGAGQALDFDCIEIWDGAGQILETVPFPDAPDPR